MSNVLLLAWFIVIGAAIVFFSFVLVRISANTESIRKIAETLKNIEKVLEERREKSDDS